MERIIKTIVNYISRNSDDITTEKKEIVSYGLELLITKALFLIIIMALSIFMHSFFECIVFTFFFSLLRTISGGYHANTRIGCFFVSMLLFVIPLSTLRIVNKYNFVIIPIALLTIIAVVIIFIFAPLDTPNNKLDVSEKQIFRKKARITLLLEIGLASIMYINFKSITYLILFAIIESSFLIIMASLKNVLSENKSK